MELRNFGFKNTDEDGPLLNHGFIRGTIFGVTILSVTLFGVTIFGVTISGTIFGVTISGTIFGVTIFENTKEIHSNLSLDFFGFCLGRTRNLVSQHSLPHILVSRRPKIKVLRDPALLAF